MGLKLLHLSDIHFKNFTDKGYLDLDKDIQNEIELDLQRLKKTYENIDIILIGGDIAFSGKEAEYSIADEWITKVCQITDCDEINVLTVPGNHDVDRDKITMMLNDIHDLFKSLNERAQIDYRLTQYLKTVDSSNLLMSPFANYNAFAQKYGSLPNGTNLLYWEKDFVIDGAILRIRGVNSALVSNAKDDEHNSKLILGSQQSMIQNRAGIINLVLCHHPPQWLYDGDHVAVDLKSRARIHLFGHKHIFNADKINDNCLVLSAGAMQPSRSEHNWEPRYNIIELSIVSITDVPLLNVKLYKRVWDKHTRKFRAEYSEKGKIYEEYNLALSNEEVNKVVTSKSGAKDSFKHIAMTEAAIDLNNPDPLRRLAYLFLGLAYHLKIKVAVELNLVAETDKDLGEVQKAKEYFKRAVERGILSLLWDKVMEYTGQNTENPFKK